MDSIGGTHLEGTIDYIIIMEIVKTHTCPCSPGKVFSSSASLSQHRKTKKHLAYVDKSKEQKIVETKQDNEIFSLKLKIEDRDQQIEKLILEKNNLEEKLKVIPEYEKNIEDLITKLQNLQTTNKRVRTENFNLRTLIMTLKKDN
jgi:hypothetical protein